MSAEVAETNSKAEEAWTSLSWKAAARAYHSDLKRSRQTAPKGLLGIEIEAGGTPNNDGLDIPDYLKRDAKAGAA
jgi:hypothetical protein